MAVFKLPDLGEGLTEAEIVAWHVAVGDTVTIDQTVVEVETAVSHRLQRHKAQPLPRSCRTHRQRR